MDILIRSSVGKKKVKNIPECPVCGNQLFGWLFAKGGQDFWVCKSCSLETIHPKPSLQELKKYYDDAYAGGLYKLQVEPTEMKQLRARRRLKEVLPYCRPGRWLDVGCADGQFVETARLKGLNAEGIDISEVAVATGRQLGRQIFCSTIEDYVPGYTYDTITSFDVLEHVLDPIDYLQQVRKLLVSGGTSVFIVPNVGSLISKLMGKNWYFYIPYQHLYYYTPATIRKLLSNLGFDVIHIGRTYKHLTWSYSLNLFKEFNPFIYQIMNFVSRVVPKELRDRSIPLYIGEMMVIARKREE